MRPDETLEDDFVDVGLHMKQHAHLGINPGKIVYELLSLGVVVVVFN